MIEGRKLERHQISLMALNVLDRHEDSVKPSKNRLVEVEVLLDFLPVGGLRQGELQEDAGLLRIQFAGGDPVLGLVVHFSVLRGGARRNAGGANHNDTVLRSLFKYRPDGLMDVTVTDTSV